MPYAPSVFLPCLTLRVFRCLLPLHPKQIFSLVNNNTCSVIIYVPPDYHNFLFFMPSGYSYPLPQTEYESRSTDNPAVPCLVHHSGIVYGVPLCDRDILSLIQGKSELNKQFRYNTFTDSLGETGISVVLFRHLIPHTL